MRALNARLRIALALAAALVAVLATPALATQRSERVPGSPSQQPPAVGGDGALADDPTDDPGDAGGDSGDEGDADPGAADDPGCDGQDVVTPFARWHDGREYALGADFEDDLADWTLDGGARAADGNERFDVGDEQDGGSLLLRPGAAATSPPICVPDQAASGRMFTRAAKGGRLRIDVLAVEGDATRRVATLRANGRAWRLSRRLALTAPGDAGAVTQVLLRFTAVKGTWRVDDLYVDPPGTG
jgi:hypothetical protein